MFVALTEQRDQVDALNEHEVVLAGNAVKRYTGMLPLVPFPLMYTLQVTGPAGMVIP